MHLIRENQNRRLWRDAVHLLIHRNGALPARNHDKFKRTVQMRRKRQAVSLVELQIARIQRMLNIVHKEEQTAKAIRSLRSLPPLL